ncbi:MAG: hypothetical protein HYS98_08360 [Deltaproteobacteria bacterium]|nr:hypothetical protein [Deltaproteobacteria bacterium]
MKKILKFAGLIVLFLSATFYFIYLGLPYERIIEKNMPNNMKFSAIINPSFFGTLKCEDIVAQILQGSVPLMSKLSRADISFSLLSLLIGRAKLNLSLLDWKDQNIGIDSTTIEDLSFQLPLSDLLAILRRKNLSGRTFSLVVDSSKDTNDLQINLNANFSVHPQTKKLANLKAKLNLKVSKKLEAMLSQLQLLGIDLGEKSKDGFYRIEIEQDNLGQILTKPLPT